MNKHDCATTHKKGTQSWDIHKAACGLHTHLCSSRLNMEVTIRIIFYLSLQKSHSLPETKKWEGGELKSRGIGI